MSENVPDPAKFEPIRVLVEKNTIASHVPAPDGEYILANPETHYVMTKEQYETFNGAYVLQEIRAGRVEHVPLEDSDG